MAEGVTLIVKAANQTITDQRIECPLDWSVLRLKDHLSAAYPSKPRAEEQRLIYSGQLLQDHLLLKNILRHPVEGNAYTVHLVCSPSRTRPSPTNSTKASSPSSSSSSSSSSSPSVAVASSVPSSSALDSSSLITDSSNQGQGSADDHTAGESQEMTPPSQPSNIQEEHSSSTSEGLRHRIVGNDTTGNIGNSVEEEASMAAPMGYASFTQMQNFQQLPSQHQLMAMQQMYAQYMASYMQYLQMGTGMGSVLWPQHVLQLPSVSASTPTPAPPTSSTTATAFSVTHTAPQSQPEIPAPEQQQPQQQQQQPQAQPAGVQQQQQQQPAPNPQLRMNAQGGEVEEDEEDEGVGRDWLDWVYVGSRIVVLLSIVYFYSTLPRFLLVVGIAMLIYLYQVGWFRPTRRVENRAEGTENNNNNQDDRNNNVPNNNNNNNVPPNLEDEAIPQDAVPQEAENIERQEPQPPQAPANNRSNNNRTNEVETDATAEEAAARPPHPSLLSLSWTFLTTFFTSLVPEQPQAM